MNRKLLTVQIVLILILLNITVVFAQSQEIKNNKVTELEGKKVIGIEIKGNKAINDQRIREEIVTDVGGEINSSQLQQDMQAIFDLGYFFDVQVLFEEEQAGVKVVFEVIENPEITEIKITGNQHLATAKIKELLEVDLPEILNVTQLNQGMKAVNQYYRDQGYMLASITDVTIKNKEQLHLTINEGYINQIKIKGNDKTKDYVVKREMKTKAGEVLNVEQLREDITNIYRLGYFKSIIPEFERLEDQQQVDVLIKVEEQKTGNFNVGVGYSSAAKFTGMINVEKDNLGGRGQKVNLNWEFGGERNNFEIGFYEPWALGSKTSLDFNLYDRNETTEDDVDVSKEGGNVTVGRPLTDDIKGYIDFDYSNIKEEFSDGENSSDNTMSLTLRGIRDTRDNILKPRSGTRQEMAIKKSGFWGTTDYAKYRLDWRKYFPVGEEDSIAVRFKTATSEGDLPSSERYYLSSLDAVRGYSDDYYKSHDRNEDGSIDYSPEENGFIGESLLLANFEYRKKLWDNITGVTFLDVGNAFERDDLNLDDFNYSVGLGIRFDTPVGQLGLDYGYAPEGQLAEKSDFSISLGNKF